MPIGQLRASRAVTNFAHSYSLSFIVTLRVVIILLTAGFACNCKGFFATVSEANNCEQGEQLKKEFASPKGSTNSFLLKTEYLNFETLGFLKFYAFSCDAPFIKRVPYAFHFGNVIGAPAEFLARVSAGEYHLGIFTIIKKIKQQLFI